MTANEGLAQVAHVKRPIGQSTLEGYSSLLTVALDAWQQQQSPDWRRDALRCLRVLHRYQKGFPVGTARYYLHLGDFHRISGSLGRAGRSYRRAEAAARASDAWEIRRCEQVIRSCLVRSGSSGALTFAWAGGPVRRAQADADGGYTSFGELVPRSDPMRV